MTKSDLNRFINIIHGWVRSGKLERDRAQQIILGVRTLRECCNSKSPAKLRHQIDKICDLILKGLSE